MARLFAIVLVLGGLFVFLALHTQGPERAFGGALARFRKPSAPAAAAPAEPAAPRGPEGWEREERTPPPGIGQRVRQRVDDALDAGTARHGGSR